MTNVWTVGRTISLELSRGPGGRTRLRWETEQAEAPLADGLSQPLAAALPGLDRRGRGGAPARVSGAKAPALQAVLHHEQALAISRELGNDRDEGSHLADLGMAYADLGDVERAIEHFGQALERARQFGDRYSEGRQLRNLGDCYRDLGNAPRGIEHHERALMIARESGDSRSERDTLVSLGNGMRLRRE